MNTINIAADATAQRIGIGNQYENEATAVVFDCSQFSEDHGAGTAQIIHRRPTESIGYVCTNVSQSGSTVTWLVTDDDTSFTGKGQVQLRWYVNDVLRESVIFPTYILPSVASSDDAPAEVKSALELLMEWVNDNTISIEDLDERIANYFDEHPIPTPVTSVNEKLGDVVLTAEDVGAYSTEEADEKFCVTDGEYDELNAGTAKQLLSDSYTLDQVPYLFRKSPDSDRAVEEIVGGTVGWNQLYDPSILSAITNEGITFIPQSDGSILVNGTANGTGDIYYTVTTKKSFGDHVVFLAGTPSGGSLDTYSMYIDGNGQSTETGNGHVFKQVTQDKGAYIRIKKTTPTLSNIVFKPILSDLTTMLGSTIADYIYSLETATAGAGVAKLKEWGFFTEDYYEYCEPTLKSVEGLVSKKTVGWNQWDEEWEVGAYDNSGNKTANPNVIRCKNRIPVLPNTTYYFEAPVLGVSYTTRHVFYDANGDLISTVISQLINATFTTPANCRYFTFNLASGYGTTYNHDICINLSDPTRNGQYEPYESHTYSLDSEVVLRGVFKLDENNNLRADGDIYPSDGNGSRRYTEYTFSGTESLINQGTITGGKVYGIVLPDARDAGSVNSGDFVSDSFVFSTTALMGAFRRFSEIRIAFPDTWSTSEVLSYLTGKKLLYELATPTTFTAQPYHNPQIVGDTEEFVTTGIVPVGHSTKYYQNLRKKIEGLPWNFSSLIAPTEVTNKATRNYTTGSYLILNNVLYKVTSNIANGGTISPNSNVTATTIMAEFMSL